MVLKLGLSLPMVEADSPPASLPSKAANASSKSPVEMPFKFQVEDRDQHFEALRAPGVRWQNGRAEPIRSPPTASRSRTRLCAIMLALERPRMDIRYVPLIQVAA